jgi:glycosyltransferase involved in cell wall biosynthesis
MELISKEVTKAHLYILGKGQEEIKLKKLVRDLQLTSTVTFVSTPIPNYKMPELYAECDVYVQPSIIEPYGIAVLEAMACGKPVVGTRVGGMRDTIKEEECGFIAAPANPADLAEKILRLREECLRNDFGIAARLRAMEKFDWNKIASEYSEILDGLRI